MNNEQDSLRNCSLWFVPSCTAFSRGQYNSNEDSSGLIIVKHHSFNILRMCVAVEK